jgi:SnoaL-like domain
MVADPKRQFNQTRRGFVQASIGVGLGLVAAGAEASATLPGDNAFNSSTKETTDMTLSLQEISDRIEIQDLLVRYCYAVDDRDWEAYRNVFTTEAVLDDTVTGGIRSNVEEHVAFMKKALSKILISQHAISTVLLDISGDQAAARVHCSCPMVVDVGAGKRQVFFQGLWYRDRLVRTTEGWRISELVEEGYWNHNVPVGFRF